MARFDPGQGTKDPTGTWIGQNKQQSRDPKEDTQMTNTWKDAQHHWSLEKCIKPNEATTVYLQDGY